MKLQKMVRKEAEEEGSRSSLQLALPANEFQTASDRESKR